MIGEWVAGDCSLPECPTENEEIAETNKMSFLISNFRRVLNAVCFLLGNSPASEFYIPTFPKSLFHLFLSPSFLLAQAIFEPNLFLYKYSSVSHI